MDKSSEEHVEKTGELVEKEIKMSCCDLSVAYEDSKWSWLICFKCFVVGFLCFGIENNFGVVHLQVMHKYNTSNVNSGKNISNSDYKFNFFSCLSFLLPVSAISGFASQYPCCSLLFLNEILLTHTLSKS